MKRLMAGRGLWLLACGLLWAAPFAWASLPQEAPPVLEKSPVEAPAADRSAEDELRRLGYADGAYVPTVRDWRHMSARERRALETFLEKNFPEVWNEVKPLQGGDNRAYGARMEALAAELVPLMEEQAENAPRTEILIREKQLEFRIQELVSEFLTTKDGQRREKTRQKLAELMGKQFDAAQERRRLDIERLEERILSLKKLMDEKSRNRDAIIQRQVEARLNPAGAAEKPERPEKTDAAEKPRKSESEPAPAPPKP